MQLIDTTAFLFKWNFWPTGKKKIHKKHKEAWDHGLVRKCLHFCSHSWPVSILFVSVSQIRPKQQRCERAPRFSHWASISKATGIFARLFHQFSEAAFALCWSWLTPQSFSSLCVTWPPKKILKKKNYIINPKLAYSLPDWIRLSTPSSLLVAKFWVHWVNRVGQYSTLSMGM